MTGCKDSVLDLGQLAADQGPRLAVDGAPGTGDGTGSDTDPGDPSLVNRPPTPDLTGIHTDPLTPDAGDRDLPVPFTPQLIEDVPDEAGCLRSSAVRRRLDLYLLVDRVFGLPFPEPLDVIDEGLRIFVNDERGRDTGVALLTLTSQCDESGYPSPDVDWGLLPQHASAIESGIATVAVNVAQAEPALKAAIGHAHERGLQHPEWEQALVVITDGFDGGFCPGSTRSSTEAVVRDGATGNPSIATYVVTLGTSGSPALDTLLGGLSLPDLARLGGTGDARLVQIEQGAGAVAEALNEVRVDAQPCHYELPSDTQGEIALALRGSPDALPKRSGEGDCGAQDGFYVGTVDATNYLMLCPATCDRIKQDTDWGHYAVLVRTCM